MKNASSAETPKLQYHQETKRRQRAFISWLNDIREILLMTKETRHVLSELGHIGHVTSQRANRALDSFIIAKSDNSVKTSLQSFRSEINQKDGVAAYSTYNNFSFLKTPITWIKR